jgi:hypothetical protein
MWGWGGGGGGDLSEEEVPEGGSRSSFFCPLRMLKCWRCNFDFKQEESELTEKNVNLCRMHPGSPNHPLLHAKVRRLVFASFRKRGGWVGGGWERRRREEGRGS